MRAVRNTRFRVFAGQPSGLGLRYRGPKTIPQEERSAMMTRLLSAAGALAGLLDETNRVDSTITITSGQKMS